MKKKKTSVDSRSGLLLPDRINYREMKTTRHSSSWFIIFVRMTLNVENVVAPAFDKRDRTKPTVGLRTPISERSSGQAPWRQRAAWGASEGQRRGNSRTCLVGSLSEKLASTFEILAQLQRVLSTHDVCLPGDGPSTFYFQLKPSTFLSCMCPVLLPLWVSPPPSAVVAFRPFVFMAGYCPKIAGNKTAI